MLHDLYAEIGPDTQMLCDIGAHLRGSNTAFLIELHGWSGVFVEAAASRAEEIEQHFAKLNNDRVMVINQTATIENINNLVPSNAELLSIDVDSTDWWLWANLMPRPRVVIVETNPLDGLHVAPYHLADKSMGYGASLDAFKLLGEAKGYDYLGRTAVNAFFTRKELQVKYRLPQAKKHRGKNTSGKRNVLWR